MHFCRRVSVEHRVCIEYRVVLRGGMCKTIMNRGNGETPRRKDKKGGGLKKAVPTTNNFIGVQPPAEPARKKKD